MNFKKINFFIFFGYVLIICISVVIFSSFKVYVSMREHFSSEGYLMDKEGMFIDTNGDETFFFLYEFFKMDKCHECLTYKIIDHSINGLLLEKYSKYTYYNGILDGEYNRWIKGEYVLSGVYKSGYPFEGSFLLKEKLSFDNGKIYRNIVSNDFVNNITYYKKIEEPYISLNEVVVSDDLVDYDGRVSLGVIMLKNGKIIDGSNLVSRVLLDEF